MNRSFRLRTAVVGVTAAALLGAGAATAAPSSPAPAPAPDTGQVATKTNTVKADRTTVKAWEQFRLHGKVQGIKAGTKVQLQQKQQGKWKNLPATSVVNRSLDYSMRVKLGMKGKQEIRTVIDGKASNVVTVTVR
ncbi:hypothetical protein [Streptomyces cacaoi]|uniref:hypothetical protein n=1 Tax=Streptomyces cacaoi TaxID=1898 RepID=UPI00261659E1|nr:hypothetical protein [Streptomyces cacaoi]